MGSVKFSAFLLCLLVLVVMIYSSVGVSLANSDRKLGRRLMGLKTRNPNMTLLKMGPDGDADSQQPKNRALQTVPLAGDCSGTRYGRTVFI